MKRAQASGNKKGGPGVPKKREGDGSVEQVEKVLTDAAKSLTETGKKKKKSPSWLLRLSFSLALSSFF